MLKVPKHLAMLLNIFTKNKFKIYIFLLFASVAHKSPPRLLLHSDLRDLSLQASVQTIEDNIYQKITDH